MRALLTFWLAPIVFFWTWYALSLHDAGGFFFSREMHDRVFAMYGAILSVDPAAIPGMVADALVGDSLILLAIVAFRRRRAIHGWWLARKAQPAAEPVPDAAYPRNAESLSSAP